MRVLILSFFYHPEPNDVKAHMLGKKLAERGHQVTAITTFPNYPSGEIYPGYKQKWRQWECKDGVRLLRVPLYPDHSRSGIKRALSYLSFTVSAALLGLVLSPRADVMWVYSPPLTTVVAGWWLSLLKRMPFVMEIQDMWPETLASTGMISNRRALSLVGKVAMFLYRRAAAVTVISPGFKENLVEKGVSADKVRIMPNWTANEDAYKPLPRDPALGEQYDLTGRFNIIYGGNIGPAQGLQVVIEAAEMLQDLPDLQIVLIGDGLELPDLNREVARRGLSNVHFIERQSSDKMPAFFAWADGLLVHLRDDPLFHMTIPSKMLSYLACGRPVVCAVAGDGADVIRQANAGIVCPPDDPQALAAAIRELHAMSPERREALGLAGRRSYEEIYQCDKQVDRYEALFEEIVSG